MHAVTLALLARPCLASLLTLGWAAGYAVCQEVCAQEGQEVERPLLGDQRRALDVALVFLNTTSAGAGA